MPPTNSIAENLQRVRERMAMAARAAGRRPEEIALMAVSKTFGPDAIATAHAAGQRRFGENRVQEFAGKSLAVAQLAAIEFHLIGHLQSNKAGKAAELFSAVDSLDSLHLAQKLDAAAGRAGKRLAVLVEINLGAEESKSGIRVGPSLTAPELDELLAAAPSLGNLEFRGFMIIPPFTEDPEGARPYFRRLRELRDRIAERKLPAVGTDVLSMGMSHDFEVAIAEGSTCVRIGTAIFGARSK